MLPRPRRGEPRRARRRTASPVSASRMLFMASCSLSFRRLPVVQARGSTTGSCLPALRRVWPLPAACNGPGPGERGVRPGSQPLSTGENESLRVRKTGQRGSSASAQPEPCRPTGGRPSRPGMLAPPGTAQRPAYPTSKSANAPLPFGPLLDEGCERPERLGCRGPLLDDGRKSSHRRLPGRVSRGANRDCDTGMGMMLWVRANILPHGQEHSFSCPVPNPERRFVTKSFALEAPRPGPE